MRKLIFFLNLKTFTPLPYMHTLHSVCKYRGSQVKVYNPSIPTVAIFLKSNKNWLSYDLLKIFQADFFHPGQKVTKLWPLNRLVSIFMQSLIGLPILVLIYIMIVQKENNIKNWILDRVTFIYSYDQGYQCP